MELIEGDPGIGQMAADAFDAALPEWKQFKFTRNDPVARQLFGDFYVIDLRTHVPTLGNDIEQFARDLGVLKPWEAINW